MEVRLKAALFLRCNWSVIGEGYRKNTAEFQEACFLLEV